MSDLIERLRDTSFEPTCQLPTPKLCNEAADELERLEEMAVHQANVKMDLAREIERLEGALREIAEYSVLDPDVFNGFDARDMQDMADEALNKEQS